MLSDVTAGKQRTVFGKWGFAQRGRCRSRGVMTALFSLMILRNGLFSKLFGFFLSDELRSIEQIDDTSAGKKKPEKGNPTFCDKQASEFLTK